MHSLPARVTALAGDRSHGGRRLDCAAATGAACSVLAAGGQFCLTAGDSPFERNPSHSVGYHEIDLPRARVAAAVPPALPPRALQARAARKRELRNQGVHNTIDLSTEPDVDLTAEVGCR